MNAPANIPSPKQIRRDLLANRYEPVPICGKFPRYGDWSNGAITDARLSQIETTYPDHTNTGIRTGHCAAIDIDLTVVAHVAEIESEIVAAIGETTLRRVGSKGCLLCYFNRSPIRKITIGTKEKRLVEILGEGQQFAAYGVHPDTGMPYEWPNDFFAGEPLQTPLNQLPEVTPDTLREVARKITEKLSALGYDGVTMREAGASAEPSAPSPASGLPVAADAVEAMLGAIPPSCDRNRWLTVCGGLCSAPVNDPDFDGLALFTRWSRGDLHDGKTPTNFEGEEDCTSEWQRDQEKRANGETVPPFGALVNLARENGYAGPSHSENLQDVFAHIIGSQANAIGPVLFSNVLSREVPPVQELIAGLIEKGTVTFLSAPGGSHKSRLAVQWGLSIDAGVPIFGRAVERSHFVYVSYEDHADEVARRAQAIARRLSLDTHSDGQFWDLSGKDAPLAVVFESGECETRPFWDALRDHLKARTGHKFVVIDSTYNALRFAGAAKINEGAVMAGISLLQRFCDETDCTMLVLWHPSQAGQERGDASGWSVAWHNAPRARLSITPVKDVEDAFELRVEKRNHGPKGKPLTLHWSDGVLLPRTEIAMVEQEGHLRRAIVRVAVAAAEQGMPIQVQRRSLKWQLDEVEREIGRRPTEREVKEALAAAMPAGLLRYVKGSKDRMAGYYPVDQHQAEELAREAKRKSATEGGGEV